MRTVLLVTGVQKDQHNASCLGSNNYFATMTTHHWFGTWTVSKGQDGGGHFLPQAKPKVSYLPKVM